jgi:hypothetical protein
VIQQRFGDLRVCMVAEGVDDTGKTDRPSQWPGRARRITMEARRGNAVQQLEIDGPPGSVQRITWKVGGTERLFEPGAAVARRMLAALDTTWSFQPARRGQQSPRRHLRPRRREQSGRHSRSG